MTTDKINSIKKIRSLLRGESDVNILTAYYHIVEQLLSQYKRVLNKAKEMEAIQLLTKIRLSIIQQVTV